MSEASARRALRETKEGQQTLLCCLCQVELKPKRVEFAYLGHTFAQEVLRCPVCGQVFIPEKLAKGRMAEVEMELEDK